MMIDRLVREIKKKKNPTVVGLDPDIKKMPACYKAMFCQNTGNDMKETAEVIYRFNQDIIDTVCSLVPAVKPQIAFYEKYGSYGISVFERTVSYAHQKGLLVVEDGKRNDIGNTAAAYAQGHLGQVELLSGDVSFSINADFLTVSPYLGRDSILPFIDVCSSMDKGIFVLVKTSNPGAGEIQDVKTADGFTISQQIALYLNEKAKNFTGESGYSSIGAVVGATYPKDAEILRKMMPASYFLVPGYGTQGGTALDILPCFNQDGLGAIVNSSRGLLYSHMSDDERNKCTKEEYLDSVYKATKTMQETIYEVLKTNCSDMDY